MKKALLFLLCGIILFSFCSCNSALKRSDELAVPFIKALLLRDNEGMAEYIHPDYTDEALPDDEFYSRLEKEHFFTIGNELTYLTAVSKQNVENTEIKGKLLNCVYLIMSNEAYYDVNLLVLDNDNGYGVIAVSVSLNTDPSLYVAS
ncbi:MAG: hypothetical protein E7586_05610 [Ruminococcaceae bacterium]|nr:hypothetical protein [Oscillospiraceae bacterium]